MAYEVLTLQNWVSLLWRKPVTQLYKQTRSKLQFTMSEFKKMSQNGKKRRQRLWWAVAFCLLIGLVVFGAWTKRTTIIQYGLISQLEKMGYQAELSFDEISAHSAKLSNVKLAQNGQVFVTIARVDVEFQGRQVLKGKLDKLTLVAPELSIEIDEKGQILSPVLSGKKESSGTLNLPKNGIFIDEGKLIWRAPFARGQTNISGEFLKPNHWNGIISSPGIEWQSPSGPVPIDLDATIESQGADSFLATGRLKTKRYSRNALEMSGPKTDFSVHIFRDGRARVRAEGWTNLSWLALKSSDHNVGQGNGRVKYATVFDTNKKKITELKGDWQADIKDISFTNAQDRLRWANMVTSYQAASIAPVAKYFVGDVRNQFAELLQRFNVSAKGNFVWDEHGYKVGLSKPLHLNSKGQHLQILPSSEVGLLKFDKNRGQIMAHADLVWAGKRALQIDDLKFVGRSKNGIVLDAIHTMRAQITSTTTWRKTVQGVKTRLAPFSVHFVYENTPTTKHIGFTGAVDYDGMVPGGIVQDIKATGAVDIKLLGQGFVMDFTPKSPIRFSKFTNSSGWVLQNARFNIGRGAGILKHRDNKSPLSTRLADLKADIVSPQGDRHLAVRIDRLDIRSDMAQSPQNWVISYKNLEARSEDFPSPGTHVNAAGGQLNVTQFANGKMEFHARSDKTKIETKNVRINQIALDIRGEPDDFMISYQAPRVKFVGGDIPILPMDGTARLRDNVLNGVATSALPLTKDMPMIITFSSQNGRGRVNIKMEKLVFDPHGLQPQHLAPSLSGKIADVSGNVAVDFDFEFGGGEPMKSKGIVSLEGVDVGTLVGPFSGIDANLQFSSFFPPKSKGVQTVRVASFDPGFPLENGTIKFEIIPGGVRILQALWPVEIDGEEAGSISIDPLVWRFGNVENQMTVRVDNISLHAIMNEVGKGKVSASGQISGTLPVVVKGVDVTVQNGLLRVKDGGRIKFQSPATEAAGKRNEMAGKAFEALKDFKYNELEARLNGPLDGAMSLRMAFDGQNKDVMGGQPYAFDIEFNGELANLARNLSKSFVNLSTIGEFIEYMDANDQN